MVVGMGGDTDMGFNKQPYTELYIRIDCETPDIAMGDRVLVIPEGEL